MEVGAEEHLGVYHWDSEARFEAERPCGYGSLAVACTIDEEVFSATIPVEHELAHMANNLVGAPCPSVLSEGLAVYYGWAGWETPSKGDLELLAKRFDAPDEKLPRAEYDVAGHFAGFLVRRFGLDAVLEVCRLAGRRPDSETFESAMKSVLGGSAEELLADLVASEPECNEWPWYRSRVFTCGEAGAARHAGVVDDELLLRYRMGCGEENTVGPIRDTIWIVEQIEFLHSGPHWVAMLDADYKVPPVLLELAQCEPCGWVNTFIAGDAVGPLQQIEAGTYWLEMRADAGFSGEFTLQFNRDIQP